MHQFPLGRGEISQRVTFKPTPPSGHPSLEGMITLNLLIFAQLIVFGRHLEKGHIALLKIGKFFDRIDVWL